MQFLASSVILGIHSLPFDYPQDKLGLDAFCFLHSCTRFFRAFRVFPELRFFIRCVRNINK